jgi:hypothetical protein
MSSMSAHDLLFTIAAGVFLATVVLVISNFSRRALVLANRRKELDERLISQKALSRNDELAVKAVGEPPRPCYRRIA